MSFSSRKLYSLLCISFSIILSNTESNDIGRQLFISCLDPPLWIVITLTNFKRLGKTPVLKETLMMLHKGTRIRSGINLSSLIGILTGPVALYSNN